MSRSTADSGHGKIVPAHLNFLAIYSPALGITEKTEHDQILYYYAKPAPERGRRVKNRTGHEPPSTEEQLRQIGLAQGIVNFARTFSNDEPADSVETEKHRIIVTELENGWWILASINLTRILNPSRDSPDPNSKKTSELVEYSSREVSPPPLLRQQLLQANSIFLLHHSSSLSDLYIRLGRRKFCDVLEGFWEPFAKNWDVLLHGNPAVDVYGGIKLAAGGEIGVGVGEEQWGSGEREVLEGLARHTDGLVDLTVCRYGDDHIRGGASGSSYGSSHQAGEAQGWLGTSEYPRPSDGLIFSGLGALSRNSLKSLTAWTQWIYRFGEDAYGVGSNPNAARRRRAPRKVPEGTKDIDRRASELTDALIGNESDNVLSTEETAVQIQAERHPDIPKPLIRAAEESLQNATATAVAAGAASSEEKKNSSSTPDTWMSYLTPDFGFTWLSRREQPLQASKNMNSETRSSSKAASDTSREIVASDAKVDSEKTKAESKLMPTTGRRNTSARFLIGFQGPLDLIPSQESLNAATDEHEEWSGRLSLRTIYVELAENSDTNMERAKEDDQSTATPGNEDPFSTQLGPEDSPEVKRLRVVVYVHQPFIFTFLFEPNTASLSMPIFFGELHRHLVPLHRSLLVSTSASSVAARLRDAVDQPGAQHNLFDTKYPIYDLIFDPLKFTIHSSILNIPMPGGHAAEGLRNSSDSSSDTSAWTRIEALNIHSQILNNYVDTRRRPEDFERTAKTNRGWSVVWMRLPAISAPQPRSGTMSPFSPRLEFTEPLMAYESRAQSSNCEAILVRKSGYQATGTPGRGQGYMRDVGTSFGKFMTLGLLGDSNPSPSEAAGGTASTRLADVIGVDARKYIEGLMSLNR